MTASGMRKGELAVEVAQPRRQPPAIHLRQQNGRGSLDHRYGSVTQYIGKPHVRRFLPQAHCVREIGVGIQLHHELRRPALAAQACKDMMKNAVGAGERRGERTFSFCIRNSHHDALRRTGGGAISFMALSTSLAASCVASIASSRLSL